MKLTKNDKLAMFLLFLGLFLLTAVPELFARINTTVDEAGTLASAAFLSGRNWHTGIVSIGGNYYKYGLSLIWTIPFLLIKDSLLLFRTIGVIDAFFLSLTPVIAYCICKCFLGVKRTDHAVVLASVSTVIPDTLFHSLYLRGDNILTVMNWVCILALLAALHAKSRRGKIVYSILLSLSSVYAFSCHSRGVVLVIAVAMTVVLVKLFLKENCVNWPAYLVSLAVFLFIDRKLQLYFLREIWQGRQSHATGIHAQSFAELFSIRGIENMLHAAIGWLYNTLVPTGGLFCIAVAACIVAVFHILRRTKKIDGSEGALVIFSSLSYLGSMALGLLFFLPEYSKIFDLTGSVRLDRIAFDRYTCSTFGVLCFAGLYILICRKDIFGIRAKAASVVIGFLVVGLFAWKIAPWFTDGRSFMKRYLVVLTLFLPVRNTQDIIPSDGFSMRLAAVGILAMLMLLLFLILLQRKRIRSFGILFVCVSVITYGFCTKYLLFEAADAQADRMENVLTQVDGFGDLYETYPNIFSKGQAGLKAYQVRLMDYQIIGKSFRPLKKMDDVLFISSGLPDKKDLPKGDFYTIDGAEYEQENTDVLLVKGSGLKVELESRGYTLTRYTGE